MSVFTNSAATAPEESKQYVAAVLGLLGDHDPLKILAETPAALERALAGLSITQLSQPETPGKWSIRQVLAHLADSELVWAVRLRYTLGQDRPPLVGYDQDAWAAKFKYVGADPVEARLVFGVVRQSTLGLLRAATPDDLRRTAIHSERGEQTLETMIRLTAGHDILHLKQIARIRSGV